MTIFSCAPVFSVSNPVDAAQYYRDCLGFEIKGAPVKEYAIVQRGGFEIHLIDRHDQNERAKAGDQGGAYLTVDDPDQLYHELLGRGARIHYPPTDQAYGMRDFAVLDSDGYWLCFGVRRS